MKCIECQKQMKLVGKEKFIVNEETGSSSAIFEYDCLNCSIKIFMNMSIADYGIEKLYLPENYKPTEKQLELVDFICYAIPSLRYERQNCYTKRQISKFISKYKDLAIETNRKQKELASKKVIENIAKNRKIKKKEDIKS